jgi:type IV pilus assembly protein PilA
MITAIHKSLAAKRDSLEKDEKGFTLIELLVVVLIIGILAAIAIPVFLGQQNSAKDSAVKSDLGVAKIAVISYATANAGSYFSTGAVNLVDTDLAPFGYKISTPNAVAGTMTVTATAAGAFCISEKSSTGLWFKILDSGGVIGGQTATVACSSSAG